jgi:Carbon-nitrogen hydrolase
MMLLGPVGEDADDLADDGLGVMAGVPRGVEGDALVMTRANAIANQVYVVSPNLGGLMGTGRSVLVDPEGHVLTQGGSGEEYLNQVLDLGRVDTVRQHGTYGMIRMWQQLRDAPPPPMPAYEQGFAAGEIMRGLGPLAITGAPKDEQQDG